MDEVQRRQLLAYVRGVVKAMLSKQKPPAAPKLDPRVNRCSGAFVTLRNQGRLRGCIGRFASGADVVQTVREMAQAALEDTRFFHDPVSADELPELDIEISILSPMRRTSDPLSLELGIHGILIRHGGRSGCFLPQVAVEQGWNKEEYLSHCCAHKAGLPADAWKDPDTEVSLFTAEVFGEERPSH
jgi:AmmeMemoRadiSam system protein A